MLTRRWFSSCVLCAASGLTATAVEAQQPGQGMVRTILQQTDGPAEGYVTLLARVEIPPGVLIPRHTHPGIETSMMLTGAGVLSIHGQPDRAVKAGESFQIPTRVPHKLQNGDAAASIAVNYVVEKGQPLATPAPE